MAEPQAGAPQEPQPPASATPPPQDPEPTQPEKPDAQSPPSEKEVVNRDPKQLNTDVVTVDFSEVFFEPAGPSTLELVWTLSQRVFSGSQPFCYMVLSTLCALPLALLWGAMFACAAFCQVWAGGPCGRGWGVGVYWVRSVVTLCLRPVFDPLFSAMATACTGLSITMGKNR
ncbi:caveolin-3 [Amia ocellicauda]|uniref:caveolin-3 n=1 Tax=Amia ocellicauda TaxID=2972642 RepID=UPI0034641395|nr:CAV3 protein [Amia calva]